jgi:S1-C subfamily serine protease
MAGQPADEDAVISPDVTGESAAHSASAVASLPGARPGEPVPDPREGVSEFGQFGWFADSDHLGERGRSADRPRRRAGGAGSGALLPGDWAKAVPKPGAAADGGARSPQAEPGGRAGDPGEPAEVAAAGSLPAELGTGSGAVRRGQPRGPRGWLGGRRRTAAARPTAAGLVGSGLAGSGLAGSDMAGSGLTGAGPSGDGPTGAGPDGRGLSGGRLALAAGGLALACTVLGGVIGGFIALHTHADAHASQVSPGYSLGTVPPALTNRPASSVAGIAARVTPSVVMIKVNGAEGTGSGFIIRGGYIVTDNHVVTLDGEVTHASLEVYFSDGKSAPGLLVGRDPYSDIAIIKVAGGGRLPALTMGNSASVEVGDPVLAVGSPLGLADTVTSGIVSAVDRPVQPGAATSSAPQVYFDAIQTDAPINPGNSGGPLVNARGQVIGVDAAIDTLGDNPLTGTQGGSIGLGFAIPVNQARRVAEELIRTGHASHAVIGADINGTWSGNGAEIMPAKAGRTAPVAPGGPAALAGLQPGDVIVKFDGQPVTNADTLLDAIRSMPPGARARLTFIRGGQPRTVSLRLGSAES